MFNWFGITKIKSFLKQDIKKINNSYIKNKYIYIYI